MIGLVKSFGDVLASRPYPVPVPRSLILSVLTKAVPRSRRPGIAGTTNIGGFP